MQADGHPARELNRSLQFSVMLDDCRRGLAHVGENAVAELQKSFSGRRQPDLPAEPHEQRFLQFLFEQEDLAADGRLRDVHQPGGSRERAGVGDGLDDFELAQVDGEKYATSCVLRSCVLRSCVLGARTTCMCYVSRAI